MGWVSAKGCPPSVYDDGSCRMVSVLVLVKAQGEVRLARLVINDPLGDNEAHWETDSGFDISPDTWHVIPD